MPIRVVRKLLLRVRMINMNAAIQKLQYDAPNIVCLLSGRPVHPAQEQQVRVVFAGGPALARPVVLRQKRWNNRIGYTAAVENLLGEIVLHRMTGKDQTVDVPQLYWQP